MSPVQEACHDVGAYMRDRSTPTMRAFDRRQALHASDPLLAFAYWIEAAADRRTETDVNALSLLSDMRDRARKLVERQTGEPFANPMFPARS